MRFYIREVVHSYLFELDEILADFYSSLSKYYKSSLLFQEANDVLEDNFILNFIVNEEANEIIGLYQIYDYSNVPILCKFFIKEQYRNKGIGTKVLENILNEFSEIEVTFHKQNKEANALYSKFFNKELKSFKNELEFQLKNRKDFKKNYR